jgi:hypothetical protein
MAAGVVFFIVFVGEPSFRTGDDKHIRATLRRQFWFIAWLSLAITLISGAAWLALTAASISGKSRAQVFSGGVLWAVLSQTNFGQDWMVRLVLALLLAGTFERWFLGRSTWRVSARTQTGRTIARNSPTPISQAIQQSVRRPDGNCPTTRPYRIRR